MRSNNVEFKLVEVSKLSANDEFMQYEPKLPHQVLFKKELMSAIENGPEDFWWPKIPVITMNELVELVADKNPNITMNCAKWREEGIALLGLIMKKAIDELGYSVEIAWKAACCGYELFTGKYEEDEEDFVEHLLVGHQLNNMVRFMNDEEKKKFDFILPVEVDWFVVS